jgi:ADP-ribose pyrophosphatase YjhB (NUDIX family)
MANDGEWRFCPVCGRELAPLTSGPDRGRLACLDGHFVHYENPAVTVMAFVQEGEDYLILQRAIEPLRRAWDLPGGFLEGAEHPTEAIRREVYEETGLDVMPRRLIGVYNGVYGDTGRVTLDFAYLCRIRGGHFKIGPESMDARWYPLDRFPDPAFPSERAALEDLRHRMG